LGGKGVFIISKNKEEAISCAIHHTGKNGGGRFIIGEVEGGKAKRTLSRKVDKEKKSRGDGLLAYERDKRG